MRNELKSPIPVGAIVSDGGEIVAGAVSVVVTGVCGDVVDA